MAHPFQRVLYCGGSASKLPGLILLASGDSLFSFRADTGEFLDKWNVGDSRVEDADDPNAAEQPPVKKRRLSGRGRAASEASSTEIVTENGERKKRTVGLPLIMHLRGSKEGHHIVVTTSEDKGLRVLELSKDGRLNTLSERFLPKKVSSVRLFGLQSVLCADKFGDVYEFSVYPDPVQGDASERYPRIEHPSKAPEDVPFTSAASELTVHTKKNLRALQNQLARKRQNSDKKIRSVEYKPILGHVSLLTDVIHARVETETGPRSYILTSDRDEHIRVSRGPPQSHIIEGFCLKHTHFVSKLCVPAGAPQLLISGGGDDHLLIWDWLSGTCIGEVPLHDFLKRTVDEMVPIAVSGIWAMPDRHDVQLVIVALERLPNLLSFCVDKRGKISRERVLELPSNVLDVAPIPEEEAILWVVDHIHQPRSTEKCRETHHKTRVGMHRWDATRQDWDLVSSKDGPLSGIELWIHNNPDQASLSLDDLPRYRELYYSIERLRKLPSEEEN